MKRVKVITASCVFFVMVLPLSLFAEALFLKDGSILEGQILSETDKVINFRTRGRKIYVNRKKVLRTVFGTEYTKKVYLYYRGRPAISGYIVFETSRYYFFRKKLRDKHELKILKSEIDVVANEPVKDLDEYYSSFSKNRFQNLLGLSLGTGGMFSAKDDSLQGSAFFPYIIGIYYYDDLFEITWFFTITSMDSDVPGFRGNWLTMTVLPFAPLGVDLGISMGYYIWAFSLDFSGTVNKFDFQGMSVGLSYRFLNRFRVHLDVLLPMSGFLDGTENSSLLPGCIIGFEAFVYDNLSLKLTYKLDNYLSTEPSLYMNHNIIFSVGYGFNVR